MQESIQTFFRYKSMDEAMMPCAEPHVNMNYMHAPDYDLQMRFLSRYMAHAAPSDRLLTLVLSVGYWVWTPEVPQVPTATCAPVDVEYPCPRSDDPWPLLAALSRFPGVHSYEGAQDRHHLHCHCAYHGTCWQTGDLSVLDACLAFCHVMTLQLRLTAQRIRCVAGSRPVGSLSNPKLLHERMDSLSQHVQHQICGL